MSERGVGCTDVSETEARERSDDPIAAHPLDAYAIGGTLFFNALWGGLQPAIKVTLLAGMAPIATAAWRTLLGVVAIWLWARWRRISLDVPASQRRTIGWLVVTFLVQISVLHVGTNFTSASHASVCISAYPLFVVVMAHFFLDRDRLSPLKLLGVVAAFGGVGIVFADALRSEGGGNLLGDVLVLFSACLLGCRMVFGKRVVQKVSPVAYLIRLMTLSLPGFFLASLLGEGIGGHAFSAEATPQVVMALLYQGVVISAFCFVGFIHLLKRYVASKLSVFGFTTPICGVLISHWLLGDPLSYWLWLGVALVALGIYLTNRG